jgi:enoyl-CoA hydratase/carnithine racemase
MGYESTQRLQVEVDGGVLIIGLSRPGAMNAFDDELHRDFPRPLMEIEADGAQLPRCPLRRWREGVRTRT